MRTEFRTSNFELRTSNDYRADHSSVTFDSLRSTFNVPIALEGFEPPAFGLGNRCSIHLSYRAPREAPRRSRASATHPRPQLLRLSAPARQCQWPLRLTIQALAQGSLKRNPMYPSNQRKSFNWSPRNTRWSPVAAVTDRCRLAGSSTPPPIWNPPSKRRLLSWLFDQ